MDAIETQSLRIPLSYQRYTILPTYSSEISRHIYVITCMSSYISSYICHHIYVITYMSSYICHHIYVIIYMSSFICHHIYVVTYIIYHICHHITACVAQLAKASYTQAVGPGFKPHPDH